MTELQQRIFDILTDEPQTSAEIAAKLNLPARSVANSLAWMRGILKADDGFGWSSAFSSWKEEPWYNYRRPKWVRMSEFKRQAILDLSKQHNIGIASN